jgi:hypothetical protein
MTRRQLITAMGAGLVAPRLAAQIVMRGNATLRGNVFMRRQPDLYVDSALGNDSGPGSRIDPWKTISKVNALGASQEGVWVYPVPGSHWDEVLNIVAPNFRFATQPGIASTDRPMLDCSAPISAGDWTKTGGRSNIYQVDAAHDCTPGFIGLWQDAVRVLYKSNLDDVDSTPGTYYHNLAGDTPPYCVSTLYVHPYGSSDPRTDDKLYEYAKRLGGLGSAQPYGYYGGVRVRRSLSGTGGINVGNYSTVIECQSDESSYHALWVSEGSQYVRTTTYEGYYPGGSGGFWIFYSTPYLGLDCYFESCGAEMPLASYSAAYGAFGGHGFGSSGKWTFKDCWNRNTGNAFGGAGMSRVVRISGNHSYGPCAYPLGMYPGSDWEILDMMIDASAGTVIAFGDAGCKLVVRRMDVTGTTGSFAMGAGTTLGSSVEITDSFFRGPMCIFSSHIDQLASFTMLGNYLSTVPFAGEMYYVSPVPAVAISDYNTMPVGCSPYWGDRQYAFATAWKALGFDAHSTP